MDDVFKALADPSRRLLLDRLYDRDGQSQTELCTGLDLTRQAVTKHLAVLQAAGLVTVSRQGREKRHFLNAQPIHALADRWIDRYDQLRAEAITALPTAPVAEAFRYTLYIRTTPERLWQALTNSEISAGHMGHGIESDWQKGSAYIWVEDAVRIEHPEQVILDADPYRRLAFAFHAFGPEPRSHVSFDIAVAAGEQVELTLVHDGFAAGSAMRDMVAHSWPVKLSSLKSGLEELGQTDVLCGSRCAGVGHGAGSGR